MNNASFDLEQFKRDGISYPQTLFYAAEADRLIEHYLDFQASVTAARGRELFIKPHLVSTWVDRIVFDRNILDVVEMAIGTDIALWSSDFFVKAAGKGTWVSWHQDLPYWNLSDSEVVSVWLALSASTHESGSMQVIPGSHRRGQLGGIKELEEGEDVLAKLGSGARKSRPGNLLSFEQNIGCEIDESEAIDINLAPGQWSIHHGNIVHGGKPNRADYDRVGFVMRFVSGSTYCKSGLDSALLVQGALHHDQFILEQRPQGDFDEAAMRELARALSYPSGFGDKPLK